MDEKTSGWGFIILIFLLFIVFGGTAGFNRSYGNGYAWNDSCAEKQEILDSARTQYLIEQSSAANQAATVQAANAIGTKIDYYGYMDLRDKVSELQSKNMQLENQIYSGAQFARLDAKLNHIECRMVKSPIFYGPVVLPDGTLYPASGEAAAPATGA